MTSFNAYMNAGQPKNVFPNIGTSPGTYGVATVWHKFVLAKQHKSFNAEMINLWPVISFSFTLCYSAVIIPQTPVFSKDK